MLVGIKVSMFVYRVLGSEGSSSREPLFFVLVYSTCFGNTRILTVHTVDSDALFDIVMVRTTNKFWEIFLASLEVKSSKWIVLQLFVSLGDKVTGTTIIQPSRLSSVCRRKGWKFWTANMGLLERNDPGILQSRKIHFLAGEMCQWNSDWRDLGSTVDQIQPCQGSTRRTSESN